MIWINTFKGGALSNLEKKLSRAVENTPATAQTNTVRLIEEEKPGKSY